MLVEILNLLKEGKTCSLLELTNRMDADIQAIKAQMEYLERCGYIKRVEPHTSCGSKCGGCTGCSHGAPELNMWELAQ